MNHSEDKKSAICQPSANLVISPTFTGQSLLTGISNVSCVRVTRADFQTNPFVVATTELPFLVENLNEFLNPGQVDDWRGIHPRLKRFINDQYLELN
jgi:hypothetical protein